MSIFPLPQFEADLEEDRKTLARLRPPSTIVVRFGAMKLVGEFPYSGDQKPGCGSKIVIRSHRGVEIGEMLTSTCPNSGCSKSVTRKEMLEYIDNSGGRDYPFFTEGRALRVATVEDVQKQSARDATKRDLVKNARARAAELGLPMKIVESEPILGDETLTFYFTSEERIDFRELVRLLAEDHKARIELRQVGARDEARLTADYERCGQHCCCKQFLKVLRPVSMRSAKVQKSTLDPLKISGRCGRLMCCLRYEDETYETLRKRLPNRGKRVGTPEGPGRVLDTQILTQLVLVELEADGKQIAVPVEGLGDPDAPTPVKAPEAKPDPLRGMSEQSVERKLDDRARPSGPPRGAAPGAPAPSAPGAPPPERGARGGRGPRPERQQPAKGGERRQDEYRRRAEAEAASREAPPPATPPQPPAPRMDRHNDEAPEAPEQVDLDAGELDAGGALPGEPGDEGAAPESAGQGGGKKRRRRWGRRRGGRGRGGPASGDAGGGGPGPAGPAA